MASGTSLYKTHELPVNGQRRRLHGAHRIAAQHRGTRPAAECLALRDGQRQRRLDRRRQRTGIAGRHTPAGHAMLRLSPPDRRGRRRSPAVPSPAPRSPRVRMPRAGSRRARRHRPASAPPACRRIRRPGAAGRRRPALRPDGSAPRRSVGGPDPIRPARSTRRAGTCAPTPRPAPSGPSSRSGGPAAAPPRRRPAAATCSPAAPPGRPMTAPGSNTVGSTPRGMIRIRAGSVPCCRTISSAMKRLAAITRSPFAITEL